MSDRTPRASNGGDGVTNGGPTYPQANPDAGQTAPGGAWPTEGELPSVAVLGGPPAQLGGYSPDPSQTPQVSNLEDPRGLSYLKCPEGLRR
jgi:hypothetical protein